MKMIEQIELISRTFGLAFVEIPLKFLIRLISVCLFAVEALLLVIPCILVEVFFMTRKTPFHWLANYIGGLSEKLDSVSDLDEGFHIF